MTNLKLIQICINFLADQDLTKTQKWQDTFPNFLISMIDIRKATTSQQNIRVQWTSKNQFSTRFILEFNFASKLHYVKISFDTPKFEKITKDRAAKFVDQLSAIGGTMGLLTGFSIISGVEIIYFAIKIALDFYLRFREPNFKDTSIHQM